VDVDAEYSGSIVSTLTGDRKGVLLDMFESAGKTRLKLEVPSRKYVDSVQRFKMNIVMMTLPKIRFVILLFVLFRIYSMILGNSIISNYLIQVACWAFIPRWQLLQEEVPW
jgi:hypothetical protein